MESMQMRKTTWCRPERAVATSAASFPATSCMSSMTTTRELFAACAAQRATTQSLTMSSQKLDLDAWAHISNV